MGTLEKDAEFMEKLQEIDNLRAVLDADLNEKRRRVQEFEDINLSLFATIKDQQQNLKEMEDDLRLDALVEYDETGCKTLYGGVSIRIMRVLEYDDKAALDWAVSHRLALQLNKRAFDKIAKNTEIECVTVREVPTATLPTKIEL